MRHAIFLRAVNVGGSGVTSVAAIAKDLGLTNIGAAGTFVSYGPSSAPALKKRIAAKLPFETEIVVVPRPEIRALVERDPFARLQGKPYVTVLAKKPKDPDALPKEAKRVRYLGVDGRFVLSLVLPDAKPGTTPMDVEKTLGVAGTTRGWPTILKVAEALDADP